MVTRDDGAGLGASMALLALLGRVAALLSLWDHECERLPAPGMPSPGAWHAHACFPSLIPLWRLNQGSSTRKTPRGTRIHTYFLKSTA